MHDSFTNGFTPPAPAIYVRSSTPAVIVQFDPTAYSVTEGGSVNIILTADSNFSVPFNVTLTSSSDEGRVYSLGMCACPHVCSLH